MNKLITRRPESRERRRRRRGEERREEKEGGCRIEGGEGGLGWERDFFFLLELVLNNCTAVCISVRAGCQAAYEISCVERSLA